MKTKKDFHQILIELSKTALGNYGVSKYKEKAKTKTITISKSSSSKASRYNLHYFHNYAITLKVIFI